MKALPLFQYFLEKRLTIPTSPVMTDFFLKLNSPSAGSLCHSCQLPKMKNRERPHPQPALILSFLCSHFSCNHFWTRHTSTLTWLFSARASTGHSTHLPVGLYCFRSSYFRDFPCSFCLCYYVNALAGCIIVTGLKLNFGASTYQCLAKGRCFINAGM